MKTGGSPHLVESLEKYLDCYLPRFRKCYEITVTKDKSGIPELKFPSEKNWSREKVEEDRQNLVSLLHIDTNEALRIVLHGHLRGVLTSEKRLLHHARLYLTEQRHLLKIVGLLFTYRIEIPPYLSKDFKDLAERYSAEIMAEPDFVSGIIETIVSNLKNPFFLESDDDNLASLFVSECLLFQIDLLNLLLVTVITVLPTDSPMIGKWVDAIETTEYFTYPPSVMLQNQANLVDTVYALCTAITIAFFDFEQDFSIQGASSQSYINNPAILTKLHKNCAFLLHSKPSASPAVFGWSCVLNIVAIRLSEKPNPAFDSFVNFIIPKDASAQFKSLPKDEILTDVARSVASAAINLEPFSLIEKALKLLPSTSLYHSVFKNYLKAGLPYVSLSESLSSCMREVLGSFPYLADDIFTDPFGDRLYSLAALRFPTSIVPFVQLAQCLGQNAYDAVSEFYTFMQPLPKEFTDYEFVENSSNTIRLTSDFSIFSNNHELDADGRPIVIVAGTQGTIHTINQVRYVIWKYTYPGWGFLGLILEKSCASSKSSSSIAVYDDSTIEIIRLLTSTLGSISDPEKAKNLLAITAEGLSDYDIIDIVFKICEDSFAIGQITLSSVCIDFISAVSLIFPDRVWSFLSRSPILGKNGQRSDIANTLGSIEIVNGTFDLTISVLNLADVLVDMAVQNVMTSKVSFKVRSETLAKLMHHSVVIFESFAYWAFSDQRQKSKIAFQSIATFEKVLSYIFDVDDRCPPNEKVTSVLASSAEYLIQQFLVPEKVDTRVLKPLLSTIEASSLSVINLDAERPLDDDESMWVFVSLTFVSVLVRARSSLNLPPSQLEKSIFSLSPNLSILYSRYPALRTAIMDVFNAIIGVSWPSSEQPSLLAHLGMHAHMFISNLTGSLQNKLETENTLMRIATCFSSIIESQQEGLSILLVTGRDTRKASHIEQESISLLQVTEKKISEKGLPEELCLSFLRSVVSAYSNWKLGTFSSSPDLAESLISFVDECFKLNIDTDTEDEFQFVDYALKYSIAEQTLLIFSVQMYKSPNGAGIQKFIKYLEQDDKILNISKKFLGTHNLKNNFQENLIKNFNFRWPKLGGLRKFAKTRFYPLIYGGSYIYSISLLDSILSSENSWVGYRKEVISGNIELSWVDAQLNLINAWSTFGTSLALHLSKNVVSDTDTQLSKRLLTALNKVADVAVGKILGEEYSAPILFNALQHRINLVFMIKYHTLRCGIPSKDPNSLQQLYNLLESSDYKLIDGIAHSGKVREPSITYRQLLRTLSIILDGFADASENAYQVIQTVLGIFNTVIIDGMTAAAGAALNHPRDSADADIVIIISLLRKCLAIEGVSGMYRNIVTLFENSPCIKSIMTLYSYSDILPNGSDDAVYGELVLGYFLEALKIDKFADLLVSNGILDLLMESPISRKIQEGGIKPTSNPKLHSLWVKGILPLLLVLLQKVGPRIVSDASVVFSFFSEQVKFAITSWRNPSEVSVSVITETTQLFLLADMLQKLAPSPDFVSELQDAVLSSRDELTGSIDYLLSHPRFLNASLVATSSDEQRLFLIEDDSDIPEGNKLLTLVQNELKDLKSLIQTRDSD